MGGDRTAGTRTLREAIAGAAVEAEITQNDEKGDPGRE